MNKEMEKTIAQQLRGSIIEILYKFYGDKTSLSTVKNMLRYKSFSSDRDIIRAICYLSGIGTQYISVTENKEDYWDSFVSLTPSGVNLAEGDEKDIGVILDE